PLPLLLMTVRNVMRNETAPISATMPVQRAKTPLHRVSSPAAIRKAAKPIAATRKGPAEVGELCGAAHRSLRTFEHASNRRHEVQEDEACEQHRESADAALRLVVMRPVRPLLICGGVVGRVAAACQPADDKERDERNPDRARSRCHGGGRASVAASGACAGGAA